MGYDISPPILSYYGWSGQKPFDTQRKTAVMLTRSPRAYVLNSIGTGKTASALFAFDFLRSVGMAKKCLVVAPLSTLTMVWEGEVFKRFPHLESVALVGPKRKRLMLMEADAPIHIINHDGISVVHKELLAGDYDTIITVAKKIREKVLQEDPKLLMWYDQAITRSGGD